MSETEDSIGNGDEHEPTPPGINEDGASWRLGRELAR
jgi:hypothetical protein